MSEWTDYVQSIRDANGGSMGLDRLDPNSYEAAAARAAYWGESPPPNDWGQSDGAPLTDYAASLQDGAPAAAPWLDVSKEVTLPGQEGMWSWDSAYNRYVQPEGPWNYNGVSNINVVHDDGTGDQNGQGVYVGKTTIDNTNSKWDSFIETAVPLAVAAITSMAGGAAIGGYMASGTGAAAGAGAAEAGAVGAAEGAAPTFTYGAETPWGFSQAGGTELGTGLYGTDPWSMAGTLGTTGDLGVGIAADGGVWAGAGGGWGGLAGGASDMLGGYGLADAFSTAKDVYKYGNNALKVYNALNPADAAPTGGTGGPSGGFAGYAGTQGTGGLSQALAAAAGVKTSAPGEAAYTDMTSEIGQIPLMNANNPLPTGNGDAMLNGRSKFPYL